MSEIFVIGHKNPDTDSVCSAMMYSQFKSYIDKSNKYIPLRCGHLNNQTQYLFKNLGIRPPEIIRDLYPRVKEIMIPTTADRAVDINAPIAHAMDLINDYNISILPVLDNGKQVGLISINEIYTFFLHNHIIDRPRYGFDLENFESIIPGHFYKKGKNRHFTAPIMIGAMPYKASLDTFRSLGIEKPVLVIGERYDLLAYAISHQFPAVVLTGTGGDESVELVLDDYEGSVYISERDSAESTRLLQLSIPVKEVMRNDFPKLKENDLFDEAKAKLIGSDYRGLPVYNSNGVYKGTVTRRCFIDKPKKQIILVDHNEARQGVLGIEQGQVIEIIDHHRLDANKTSAPIYMSVSPVGSTCTIVYQHYKQYNVPLDKNGAKLLLAGILSDTILLKSPTTTQLDRIACEDLSEISNTSINEFGEELFKQTTVITEVDPNKLISSDFKIYKEFGFKIGIGQVEVVTLENVDEIKKSLQEAIELYRLHAQLDWVMLLITDVMSEESILVCSQFDAAEKHLLYLQRGKGVYFLPGILSRKKQLLPEIFRVLEEIRQF